ncbi:transglutaminase domain-containing protein [bacterium]|nr:transglutaminase domain-containing protein [bacterium]
MNSQWRDLFIFIILVAIGCYIWMNKQNMPVKKAPEPPKVQEEAPKPRVTDKKFAMTYQFDLDIKDIDNIEKAILMFPVPKTSTAKQTISDIKYSRPNVQIQNSDDSKFAKITITDFVNEKPQVIMTLNANLHTYDYQRAIKLNRNYDQLSNRSRYVKDEKNIEVNSKTVRAAANQISGKTNIDILMAIADYMNKNLELGHSVGNLGAEKALKAHKAGTTDYANVFVALARAKGLPARIVSGYRIDGVSARRHAWAEVYFQKYGWVTFDPHYAPVDITELEGFYVACAVNSFIADSVETFYSGGHMRAGRVYNDVQIKEL